MSRAESDADSDDQGRLMERKSIEWRGWGSKINRTAGMSILTGTQQQPNQTTLFGTAEVRVQAKKIQANTGTNLHKFLLEFLKREGVFLCRVAWIHSSVYLLC